MFGRTLNPYNLSFTPGGSSGGEAALLALHGSVLGVGSDIGGCVKTKVPQFIAPSELSMCTDLSETPPIFAVYTGLSLAQIGFPPTVLSIHLTVRTLLQALRVPCLHPCQASRLSCKLSSRLDHGILTRM